MIKNRCYVIAVAKREGNPSYNPRDYSFSIIPNGWNYWVADPFPIEREGTLYIFAELFEFSRLKGSIAYTKLTDEGFTPWKIVITEPYHLSFPYVFDAGNDLFICPETHENHSLQIYKCISFPEKWILYKTIMTDENCVDTVFLEKDDHIIGLTCDWRSLDDHTLRLIRIQKKTLKYEFSAKNNIGKIEPFTSRPAGKLIQGKDRVIMVSQICTPLYGSGLIFKDIQIDYPIYEEKELFRVYPNQVTCDSRKRFDGIHTFNYTENYVVIDLIWSRFNAIEKIYRVKKHFNV